LSNSPPSPIRITRRTLLKAGIAGGTALLLAHWLRTSTSEPGRPAARSASAPGNDASTVLAAIIPVILAGALPAGPGAASAREAALAGALQAIAGLPPAARKELDQLFALLAFPPTRCAVAGVWSAWPDASAESVSAFLSSWRDSRLALFRSAYDALHQIVYGAWYGNPRSWAAIGYAGPPSLEIG